MSTTGEWEGATRPRRRGTTVVVALVLAVIGGVVVGRMNASPPAPADLVVGPTTPPVELEETVLAAVPTINGRWRAVSAAPLAGRVTPAAAWTGSQVLVWGGIGVRPYADGALYDPATDRWRQMAKGPLSARYRAAAVVNDSEVVIAGGEAMPPRGARPRAIALRDAAAYNPASDSWRSLPDLPYALGDGRLFAVAGRVYAVSRSLRERPVAVLDRGSAAWRMMPPAPVADGAQATVAMVGATLLLWPDEGGDAMGLDLWTGQWRRIAHARASVSLGSCACTLVAGTRPSGLADVVVYDGGKQQWWRHPSDPLRLAYNGAADRLLYLMQSPGTPVAVDRSDGTRVLLPSPPNDPAFQAVPVWTGEALFVWSGANPLRFRYSADGLLFEPGSQRGNRRRNVF